MSAYARSGVAVLQMRNIPILFCTLVSTLVQSVCRVFFRQKYPDGHCMKSLNLHKHLLSSFYTCKLSAGQYGEIITHELAVREHK